MGIVISSISEGSQRYCITFLANYQMFYTINNLLTIINTPVVIYDGECDILATIVFFPVFIRGFAYQHAFQIVEVRAKSDDFLLTLQIHLKALVGRLI